MNNPESPVRELVDPICYLKKKRRDITHKFKRMGFSEEEAAAEVDWMAAFVVQLEPLRDSQSETDAFLETNACHFCRRGRMHRLAHLIRATANDSSYGHAYNTFVYYGNLYLSLDLKRKEVNEPDHLVERYTEKAAVSAPPEAPVQKLSLAQIALKYIWEETPITKENRDEIAARYGFKSGRKLYSNYNHWSLKINRVGDPESKLKITNKMVLFENVILNLKEQFRQKAQDELIILKRFLKKNICK